MSDKLIAFGYYGGKYSHLDWLLPLLPTRGVKHYVEPFGGSGAVLFNRIPTATETYNDLDGEVVNFFKVLREQKDALLEQLAFTPYSRDEFVASIPNDPSLPPLERARRFYVRIRQIRSGLADATPGRWAYTIHESRNNMSAVVSRFYNGLDNLTNVALRLLSVQIENLPALDLIGRYDSDETLFYLDPPYTPDVAYVLGAYKHVMSIQQHRDLIASVKACKAKVAISGYDNPTYTELLKDWHITHAPSKHLASSNGKSRQEVLWTNYDPAAISQFTQMPLFAQPA